MPLPYLNDWLAPSFTMLHGAKADQVLLPEIQYEKVIQEPSEVSSPVTVAMAVRKLQFKEKFMQRHVILVSPNLTASTR